VVDDPFRNAPYALDAPAIDAFAVTKSDSTIFFCRGLYVGGAGDVVVTMVGGSVVTFSAVPAGSILPVRCTQVRAATTATLIVGLN
jgi:hypothetical protein